MKIVIVGPGALGCLLAASLLRSELSGKTSHLTPPPSIILLDSSAERAALLTRQGLTLEEGDKAFSTAVHATSDPGTIGKADLFLLCVKSGDVPEAISRIAPILTSESLVITFQNGIGHLPHVLPWPLPGRVALGVTSQGATMIGPGRVRHAGHGPTLIGFPDPVDRDNTKHQAKLHEIADFFTVAGLATEVVGDILDRVWGKLFINTGINALTAIHNCANGQLLSIPTAQEMMAGAVQEAVAVARAKGITILGDPVARTREVCRATATNISSMLQDVRRKKNTEIRAINGAVVAEAHTLGIAAPVNELLVRKVREIENLYLL